MATKFKKGNVVRLKTVVPAGPVIGLRMDDNGEVQAQIEWIDAEGQTQQRWFDEDQLEFANDTN